MSAPASASPSASAIMLLVATAGCNQIFGLHDNLKDRDAAVLVNIDAGWWAMQVSWQVLEGPTGPIDYPPIDGVKVEVGPIDPTDGALLQLPVDPVGTFLVPPRDTVTPYRLVYTIDALPTEIQSTLQSAHFVVPMIGRLARGSVPPHALLDFNPTVYPGTIAHARFMTVGLWSSTMMVPGDAINLGSLGYTYDYQQYAVSMAGPLGDVQSPDDLELVMSHDGSDVNGYAVMSVPHLNPNDGSLPPATGPSTWSVGPPNQLTWIAPSGGGPLDPFGRMMSVVPGYNPGTNTSLSWGGVIPSDAMPSFVKPIAGDLDGAQVAPLSTGYASPHAFVNPFAMAALSGLVLPTAVYVKDTTSRIANGVTLTSGFQAVALQPTLAPAIDMHYDVGIAHVQSHEVSLTWTPTGGSMTTVELAHTDGKTLALGGATLADLTFDADRGVDDCVATIYLLSGGVATPVRRLLLQQPPTMAKPFRITTSVFAPGQTYVFGVVCRKGQTGVTTGDYTKISYPYQTSTLYSSTFSVTL